MRLAISNIAWDPDEDAVIAALLQRYEVDAIDLAPSKYFALERPVPADDLERVRGWWQSRGFEITGMQALLFGTRGLNVFGPEPVREEMLSHLDRVCAVGAGVGGRRLVFGSPKNRDRGSAVQEEAERLAVPFFQRLGDIAASHGVTVCLEPNPPRYGANFLTTSAETAAFVRRVAHPAIRMQLDTGALTISEEAPARVLAENAELVGHVHVSEPDLVPIGDGSCDHTEVARALREHVGEPLVSIEMLATKNEPHAIAIERALKVAIRHYGVERRVERPS